MNTGLGELDTSVDLELEGRVVREQARAALFGRRNPVCLGRYVVLDQIGRGGLGVVHAAYDPELDRKVAIKLVRPDRAEGSDG